MKEAVLSQTETETTIIWSIEGFEGWKTRRFIYVKYGTVPLKQKNILKFE